MPSMTLNEMAATLKLWQVAYYNDEPLVDDPTYDSLYDTLTLLDPDNAVLKQIGAPVEEIPGAVKIAHLIPMGSLTKAKNAAAMLKWYATVPSLYGFHITDKMDGISVSAQYKAGKLVQAVTRGDGDIGIDITRNFRLMKGVKETIPGFTGFIRGEIVITLADFDEFFPGASNTRNTASGTAQRQSNPEKCEHLTVYFYDVRPDAGQLKNKTQEFAWLEAQGLKTPRHYFVADLKGIEEVYASYVASVRAGLDYVIDGLVVLVDDNGVIDAMGSPGSKPNAGRAYKFPHAQAGSVLREIIAQVGKSGRITPVAVFDTVTLDGAQISRASLSTWGRVEALRLFIGCRILVSRRNQVIPYVEANLDLDMTL